MYNKNVVNTRTVSAENENYSTNKVIWYNCKLMLSLLHHIANLEPVQRDKDNVWRQDAHEASDAILPLHAFVIAYLIANAS